MIAYYKTWIRCRVYIFYVCITDCIFLNQSSSDDVQRSAPSAKLNSREAWLIAISVLAKFPTHTYSYDIFPLSNFCRTPFLTFHPAKPYVNASKGACKKRAHREMACNTGLGVGLTKSFIKRAVVTIVRIVYCYRKRKDVETHSRAMV